MTGKWPLSSRIGTKSLFSLGLVGLIVCYFLLMAGEGVRAYFTPDDGIVLDHLHSCFTEPIGDLVQAALLVVTPSHRPLGALYYRVLFSIFGLNPLPFRISCFALMVCNLLLAYALFKRLTGQVETVLLSLFVFSYHANFLELYWNTGNVYEILCFLFYVLGLLYYLAVRSKASRTQWHSLFVLLGLYGCALNCKEMAVTFPAVLLLFEVLYSHPRWPLLQKRPPGFALLPLGLVSVLTLAYVIVKTQTPNVLSVNTAYQPRFSLETGLRTLSHYLDLLVYQQDFFGPASAALLLLAISVLCLLYRQREMTFGFSFALIAMLPILFVIPRSGAIVYLPMLGIALGVSSFFIRLNMSLAVRFSHQTFRVFRLAVLIAVVSLLAFVHYTARGWFTPSVKATHDETRQILSTVKERYPVLPPGTRILFRSDPFPPDAWSLQFLVHLAYRDPTIGVDRIKQLGRRLTNEDLSLYDHIFSFSHGTLTEEPIRSTRQSIEVLFSPNPATPGQEVILTIRRLANRSIDLSYYVAGRQQGTALAYRTLDETGKARFQLPDSFGRGRLHIHRVRASGEHWFDSPSYLEIR